MKVLLIEDELPAADRLKAMIRKYDDRILIEGPLESNEAILGWFEQNEMPDLILSDIELLDGPVFLSFERLNPPAPIIFTTAYDQYTMKAFQTTGISYLLKPFVQEQLTAAMNKFRNLQQTFQTGIQQQLITELKKLHSKQAIPYKSRLNIKIGQDIYLLQVAEITCIRTKHGVPYAFKSTGKKLPLSEKISTFEEILDPNNFFRINRSEIVQADFIEKVEPYFNDRLAIRITGQKEVLITSAAKTPDFRRWINQL